jgi:ribonuclease T2
MELSMLRQVTRFTACFPFRHALIGIALVAALVASQGAGAQERVNRYGDPVAAATARTAGEPGKFDFYVLALSWSPSFCEVSHERYSNRTPDQQCSGRPYAFVVHGLWPQYERGFPSNCQQPAPRLSRTIVDSMLELMPSPRLVYHEWDRHGTCTGLAAAGYFDAVRQARGKITIPSDYVELSGTRTVSPTEVADAFLAANPGLSRDGLAVTCDDKRLTGVRICMSKDFAFRDCGEIAKRACKRDSVTMPPMRGGRAADAR